MTTSIPFLAQLDTRSNDGIGESPVIVWEMPFDTIFSKLKASISPISGHWLIASVDHLLWPSFVNAPLQHSNFIPFGSVSMVTNLATGGRGYLLSFNLSYPPNSWSSSRICSDI